MKIDPRDGKKGIIGFESMHDFDKVRSAVRTQRREDQSKSTAETPSSFLGNGGSTECWVRITGKLNTTANAYPARITFRNLEYTGSGNPAWFDGESVMVIEANDLALKVGRRYKGQIYGTKVWGSGNRSFFVMVDTSQAISKEDSDCAVMMRTIGKNMCALLTMPSTTPIGSCLCVPAQSVKMKWNEAASALLSVTSVFGCPPGVITTVCPAPTGGPKKYSIVLADLTGDSAVLNGGWTFTYSATVAGSPDYNLYTATKGGLAATLKIYAGGAARVTFDPDGIALDYSMSGGSCCSPISLDLNDSGSAADPPSNITATPATACGKGVAYTAKFYMCKDACGVRQPVLAFVPPAASGAQTIVFDPPKCDKDDDGNKYMDFSTDHPLLCSGTKVKGCSDNRLIVRITCEACPCSTCTTGIEWSGAGYYTIDGSCCEYYDADPGDSVVLCDGPFETDEECHLVYLACCPTTGIPRSLCIKLESPDCGITEGGPYSTITLTYDYTDGAWKGGYVSGLDLLRRGYFYTVALSIVCDGAGMLHWSLLANRNCYDGAACGFLATSGSMPCDDLIGSTAGGTFAGLGCGADCGGFGPNSICDGTAFTVTLTDEECEENPPPVTYICVDLDCIEVFDGSGKTLAECQAECRDETYVCGIQPGDIGTVAIPDGPNAGTPTGEWEIVGEGALRMFFTLPGGGTGFIDAIKGPPDAIFARNLGGSGSESGVANCETVVMTFPPGTYGATGSVTVTT